MSTCPSLRRCPFCRKGFDYSPDDFHRKVQCGNKGCTREFGFMQYNVSESRLKELREELKSSQERRIKRQEAIMRRNARASTKGGGSGGGAQDSGALALAEEVKAFKAGLLDECPRCGWSMGKRDGADEAVEHLKGCKDEKKVAAHQKKKRQAADLQRQRDAKKGAQEEVTGLKTWEFLGGENENMWLLSEEQLRKQCKQYGLETDGEKNEMIARLVRHRNALDSSRMIADSAGGGTARNKGASMPTRHTLPSNLETMTLEQLKSVVRPKAAPPRNATPFPNDSCFLPSHAMFLQVLRVVLS